MVALGAMLAAPHTLDSAEPSEGEPPAAFWSSQKGEVSFLLPVLDRRGSVPPRMRSG